ncbi:hypothetical protein EOA64_00230 [Mesorhizobium sp. M1A.F.Ca.IN.022.02.1.1]|uniref:hypothetical protein n=1 Tax=Mesorhizobium sp. M1A.F.Ca.IN.022.02.1.1 TaxID=2496766 RepID=UPI000FCBA620|nr:hypothetical protein [Mesorhizobium sp. M1A.F.Ca.IN.022.02.1.1]RUV65808.1 hypothetical protein EOA64_00230 [Mesorhizobium sp. M1A.F.Ca.IN.022.02.1.1]RWI33438.1 MAG: hypothetical protein EOR13_17960 [Mesorhizobium sp.]
MTHQTQAEPKTNREALFQALRELTKDWNEYDPVPRSQQLECQHIGESLCTEGGINLMQDAYYDAKARNRSASVIQAYWDGIGDWRW